MAADGKADGPAAEVNVPSRIMIDREREREREREGGREGGREGQRYGADTDPCCYVYSVMLLSGYAANVTL